MRISDWSSDVCSSDLVVIPAADRTRGSALRFGRGLGSWLGRGFVHRCRVGHVDGNTARVLLPRADVHADAAAAETAAADAAATGAHAHSAAAVAVRGPPAQTRSASWRERVWQYV